MQSLFSGSGGLSGQAQGFMAAHLRRKALIQRLVKAGIWKDQ